MKAEEARLLVDQYEKNIFEGIIEKIRTAAMNGNDNVIIIDDIPIHLINELRNLGYSVNQSDMVDIQKGQLQQIEIFW